MLLHFWETLFLLKHTLFNPNLPFYWLSGQSHRRLSSSNFWQPLFSSTINLPLRFYQSPLPFSSVLRYLFACDCIDGLPPSMMLWVILSVLVVGGLIWGDLSWWGWHIFKSIYQMIYTRVLPLTWYSLTSNDQFIRSFAPIRRVVVVFWQSECVISIRKGIFVAGRNDFVIAVITWSISWN